MVAKIFFTILRKSKVATDIVYVFFRPHQKKLCLSFAAILFNTSSSLIRARKELSDLHVRLADEGFTEVFVDQLTKDMVAVTRHCPQDRR